MYDWNPRMNFEWYVKNSGLNAVELNASFYRFPYPSQISSWSRRGRRLRWSIKVHRSITHYFKLNDKAIGLWEKFYRLFKPMDDIVDFYLFQLPPSFRKTSENVRKLKNFLKLVKLGERAAIEFRHDSWFNSETIKLLDECEATIVSIDSPIATWIAKTSNNIIYLRMHGRTSWYAHDYSEHELLEIASKIASIKPSRVYVFFNNNHWMLGNARLMLRILNEVLKSKGLSSSLVNSF